ncbi:GIY-YIG nuclease family protein [bacterium]|nr:GIY-YIG nuclease family protein [bacterium]
MDKLYYTYIITNKPNGTLYIGITSDIIKRVWQHKNKVVEGFSEKYNLNKLVYFEEYTTPEDAIRREKRLKFWKRQWKIDLIEKNNPDWKDLYEDICG